MFNTIFLIRKSETPVVLAKFDRLYDAMETKKVLDRKIGEHVYLCLEANEAYIQFPKLKNIIH